MPILENEIESCNRVGHRTTIVTREDTLELESMSRKFEEDGILDDARKQALQTG